MNKTYTENKTLTLFMVASFFNGFIFSLGAIQDIVAKKALHAADWQIMLLTMLWPVSSFFSIWWGKILENSRNKSPYFWIVAIFGRLILIIVLFISNVNSLILILGIMYSFNSLFVPLQNALLQANFKPKSIGSVFGYSVCIANSISMVIVFVAGKLLDFDESFFRYIFFFIGIAGFLGTFIMTFINMKNSNHLIKEHSKLKINDLLFSPVLRTIEVLKTNKDFAIFERNFFIYGLGFIVVLPVIPKFLVEDLQMTYTLTFLAKGILAQLGIIILSPILGKISSNRDPNQFTGYIFFALAFYPITLLLASLVNNHTFAIVLIFVAYLIFGIAMSGVVISWNISSIHFAGKEDASMYQAVHLTLTGIRGIIAPLLGYFVMTFIGIQAVFAIASGFLFLASYLSFNQFKIIRERNG